MRSSTATWLAFVLAAGAAANPLLRPRRVPWPDPVPASSIGPIDWSSVHAPIYSPPSSQGSPGKTFSAIKAATSSTPPTVVDWRNRSGLNYITTPQDQGVCDSCWAFAVTALIESMVRVEHGVWSKRSEADVHDGVGAACESVGNAEDTLAWVAGQGAEFISSNSTPPGIADWPCDPYQATEHPYEHCSDRSGRATRIPFYQALGAVDDQKKWLDQYGPLVATFILYSDFDSWKPTAQSDVYKWDGVSQTTGNHLALIVGYDDEKQAWIMKNSWGKSWGENGFVHFAYGNANIDEWTKYGLTNVNPDPWTRRRHQSGSMLQSGNGDTHRNFELLVGNPNATGFTHISRDGTSAKWSKVSTIQSNGLLGQPAIIGTSYNRDFHAVAVNKDQTVQLWAYSQSGMNWSQISTIDGKAIDGFPGLTQGDGSQLIMVVKHADGTLNEWQQRPNSTVWTLSNYPIASNIAQSGPALVQSNVDLDLYNAQGTSRGNLYTVAVRSDGQLQLFWRSGQDTAEWSAGEVFGSGVPLDTPPVMIQDYFGTANETSVGGFQLVVAVNGSVQHWQRANDDISLAPPVEGAQGKWRLAETTGTGVKHVWALVQGSFNQKMHMITEGTDGGVSYWEWDGSWAVVQKLPALDDSSWTTTEPG
ncbi:d14614d7-7edf-49d7-b461-6d902ee31df1 [Thermothielavioides terrestris]|uniref:D14614d7-7edf-49d7-b461-6d902ee31df1 n=1 Tax=Thermothielavioides terrestris TaxID=2587410 RepID=A0A3S4CB50_9PEZI|nr:d14614d7-7edf-49d7-b461-6d902ee31df1 [Thermothielavioides terrestris]